MLVRHYLNVESSPTEHAIDRLHRSGWHLSVTRFTDTGGRTVWEIAGRLGDNQFTVVASARNEAWHKAALAAASYGMLHSGQRSATGRV
jgi:hypothetical protein